jgi:ankyrin repeat protein
LLIANKVDLSIKNQDMTTPLHIAAECECGGDALVNVLINARADVDVQDFEGKTPLHLAVIAKNSVIAEILLKRGGAKNTITDNDLYTAADYASDELEALISSEGQSKRKRETETKEEPKAKKTPINEDKPPTSPTLRYSYFS